MAGTTGEAGMVEHSGGEEMLRVMVGMGGNGGLGEGEQVLLGLIDQGENLAFTQWEIGSCCRV